MKNLRRNRLQREYRALNHSMCTKKYEKTISGFLMRMYRNMKSRIVGVQRAKYHLYKGKYLLPRKQFYRFALKNMQFLQLYTTYINSHYQQKLAPSINRIDSSKGYSLDNMEFITQSENSRLGGLRKRYA